MLRRYFAKRCRHRGIPSRAEHHVGASSSYGARKASLRFIVHSPLRATAGIDQNGEVLIPLREDEVRHAARALKAAGVEAIAVGFLEMSRRYWQAWLHQTPGPSDPGTPRHQIQHMIDLPHQELSLKRALEPPWRRAPCHETKNPYGKYLFPIDQASQCHGCSPCMMGTPPSPSDIHMGRTHERRLQDTGQDTAIFARRRLQGFLRPSFKYSTIDV